MLKSLKIENVALIEEQYIEFYEGLNVISGETGAGKSIIINALSFALGSRADKTLIRTGADYAKVTANFIININNQITEVLNELEVPVEENIVIVRKMFVDGKSDIKVNGMPFSLSMLKRLTASIIDIYGQFEHSNLLDERKHLSILDDFGGKDIQNILNEYKLIYDKLYNLYKQLQEYGGDEKERLNKIDYLTYQINEIKMINPQIDEDIELTNKKNVMLNAEKLADAYNFAKMTLDESEYNARLAINLAKNKLNNIISIDNNAENLVNRLKSLEIELDDIINEISNLSNNCEFNEQEFNEIDQRLDSIKLLKRKYGNQIQDILNALEIAENQLTNLNNCNEIIDKITNEINETKNQLMIVAQKLSQKRQEIAKKLENEMSLQFKELGMNSASFVVKFDKVDFYALGIDKVEFMFSANLGEPVKSLNKIISGGELSRFMLGIKTIFAKINNIGTQIYDEIDAGISGHIGQVIAIKLNNISKTCQVITISHLSQIVSMADYLFKIQKIEKNNKTYSILSQLNEDESLLEIARLSGGENIGNHAIEFAKQMKNWAKNIKKEK